MVFGAHRRRGEAIHIASFPPPLINNINHKYSHRARLFFIVIRHGVLYEPFIALGVSLILINEI